MQSDSTNINVPLVRMQTLLRSVYIRLRAKQAGRKYSPQSRSDNNEAWKKPAQTCINLNADPEVYLTAQFTYLPGTVFPNMCHGSKAVGNYQRYMSTHANDVAAGTAAEAAQTVLCGTPSIKMVAQRIDDLKSAISSSDIPDGMSITDYLAVSSSRFDALAVMACYGNVDKIRDVYKDRAMNELNDNPYLKFGVRGLNIPVECINV
ncbi:MAG: hypothetical protein RR382_00160 [Tannerellaceae bacterium]